MIGLILVVPPEQSTPQPEHDPPKRGWTLDRVLRIIAVLVAIAVLTGVCRGLLSGSRDTAPEWTEPPAMAGSAAC